MSTPAARFFSEIPVQSPCTTLSGAEHQHLAKVLRLDVGDRVTLFDGSGKEFTAIIKTVGRGATELAVEQIHDINREPLAISLAVALPKGDRQHWLVEKAVELGVHTMIPLLTERGVAQPGTNALARIHKWVIAACKQCGRNRLMEVLPAQALATVCTPGNAILAHLDANSPTLRDLIAREPCPRRALRRDRPRRWIQRRRSEAGKVVGKSCCSAGA